MQQTKAKLTIVSGFLGSGKTTWLRHQLRMGPLQRARVVVNETAETPFDGELLGKVGVATISGGCACCSALGETMALLREMVGDLTHTPPGSDPRIVLETSGLAEPGPIKTALEADPTFRDKLFVSEVVTLVDALKGLELLRREHIARSQVRDADAIILTKLDLVENETSLETLVATIQHMNPGAQIFGSQHGVEEALPEIKAAVPEEFGDEQNLPPAVAITLETCDLADWPALALWLACLVRARPAEILRVKGIIGTLQGRILIQGLQGALAAPELLPDPNGEKGSIVIIGRGFDHSDLQKSLRAFGRM